MYLLLTPLRISLKLDLMKDLGKTRILGIDIYVDRSSC
jgi:hypothetical protein